MASEIAEHIARLVGLDGDEDVPDVVDNALAEVREVLESFGCEVLSGSKGLCFGVFGGSCDDVNHGERCQRARALYERLQP